MRTVLRARIDEKTRDEAAAVLDAIGLTVSDAFLLMMVRIAAEKRLPFDPLTPNEETIEAMRAARRGEVVSVGDIDGLMAGLNAEDLADGSIQAGLQAREEGPLCKTLDGELASVLASLAGDRPLAPRHGPKGQQGRRSEN
ncbi:MAG: type II toxin-antitoxin system RelB/DinJ family antitoxin [Albidovulum sp.]|nr:type II toxin-antitoxin system RelB/DinJ family antitoxin [Albidovulum sp.]